MTDIAKDRAFLDDVEGRILPWLRGIEGAVDARNRAFAADVHGKIGVTLIRLAAVQPPRTRPLPFGQDAPVVDGDLLRRKELARQQLELLMMKAYRRVLAKG